MFMPSSRTSYVQSMSFYQCRWVYFSVIFTYTQMTWNEDWLTHTYPASQQIEIFLWQVPPPQTGHRRQIHGRPRGRAQRAKLDHSVLEKFIFTSQYREHSTISPLLTVDNPCRLGCYIVPNFSSHVRPWDHKKTLKRPILRWQTHQFQVQDLACDSLLSHATKSSHWDQIFGIIPSIWYPGSRTNSMLGSLQSILYGVREHAWCSFNLHWRTNIT